MVNNMGSEWSSQRSLHPLRQRREEWRETPLPLRNQWRVSHGYYRLLENILTGERIEQYTLTFQEERQYEQYLQSFKWRRQEPFLVPAKHIERSGEGNGFCGGRVKAMVCLPHTPRRLSNLEDISLSQGLYILSCALSGFAKIFQAIGYLRVSDEMVGIGSQGNIIVWLSSNFSSNYLYGPHYVEPQSSKPQNEAALVNQIVAMVERRMDFEEGDEGGDVQTFSQFVGEARLNFASAQHAIKDYANQHGVTLPQFMHLEGWGLGWGRSDSNSHLPSRHPQQRSTHLTSNIQHRLQSQMGSSHHTRSEQHHFSPLPVFEKEEMREMQGDTTGETAIIGRFEMHPPFGTSLPKISFNYGLTRQECFQTPSPSHHSTLRNSLATPNFTLPLSLIPEQQRPQRVASRRITYIDKQREHCLDEELVQDLGKYFP